MTGLGVETDTWLPTPVAGDHRFQAIVAGIYHSCGLDLEGEAWCWGGNEQGQLGQGEDASQAALLPSNVPVLVVGGHVFTRLASTGSTTCGLTADGTAWCWGRNDSRQLGVAEPATVTTPVQAGGELRFTELAPGFHHTCGLTGAREIWCWGHGWSGQLGDGNLESSVEPVKVVGDYRWVSVNATNNVSCGRTEANEAYCWGDAYSGATGAGFGGPGYYTPVPWPVVQPAGPVE